MVAGTGNHEKKRNVAQHIHTEHYIFYISGAYPKMMKMQGTAFFVDGWVSHLKYCGE
jgi:hypothetical protein